MTQVHTTMSHSGRSSMTTTYRRRRTNNAAAARAPAISVLDAILLLATFVLAMTGAVLLILTESKRPSHSAAATAKPEFLSARDNDKSSSLTRSQEQYDALLCNYNVSLVETLSMDDVIMMTTAAAARAYAHGAASSVGSSVVRQCFLEEKQTRPTMTTTTTNNPFDLVGDDHDDMSIFVMAMEESRHEAAALESESFALDTSRNRGAAHDAEGLDDAVAVSSSPPDSKDPSQIMSNDGSESVSASGSWTDLFGDFVWPFWSPLSRIIPSETSATTGWSYWKAFWSTDAEAQAAVTATDAAASADSLLVQAMSDEASLQPDDKALITDSVLDFPTSLLAWHAMTLDQRVYCSQCSVYCQNDPMYRLFVYLAHYISLVRVLFPWTMSLDL